MSHYSVGVPTCSHRSSTRWKREPHSGNRSLVGARIAVSEHGEPHGTLKGLKTFQMAAEERRKADPCQAVGNQDDDTAEVPLANFDSGSVLWAARLRARAVKPCRRLDYSSSVSAG